MQRSIKVPWKSAQNRDKRLIRALVSAKTIKKTSPSWAKGKWSGADFFRPENVLNQSKYFQVPPTTSMICWRVTPNVSTRGEDSFSTGRFCLESKEFEKWNQQKPISYNGLLVSWVKRRTYVPLIVCEQPLQELLLIRTSHTVCRRSNNRVSENRTR